MVDFYWHKHDFFFFFYDQKFAKCSNERTDFISMQMQNAYRHQSVNLNSENINLSQHQGIFITVPGRIEFRFDWRPRK